MTAVDSSERQPLGYDAIDMLAFKLKLVGKQTKKNVLVSAGKLSDKQKMLPILRELSRLNVSLFATTGTHGFLKQHDVGSQELFKITQGEEPNIRSFLRQD